MVERAMTVGQALVAGLAARGVKTVFGIPGVHTVELYRGLAGSGIRHVTPRHEQGAGFMADGYARVSGRPGVAFVITGPGVTNTLTALAQARADSVPVLLVSSVNAQATLGRGLGYLHEMPDQAGLVQALCPSLRISTPELLDGVLDRAFALMLGGRPGPVHLELPMDVLAMPAVAGRGPVAPLLPGVPAEAAVSQAVAQLQAAARPVILAGGGARRAGDALRALAERLDAPVVMTTNARGLMHGHSLGVPASPSLDAVRGLIAAADRVLAVGTELGPTDYDMYGRGGMPDLAGMIRVDCCAAQLARHPAALTLLGGAEPVLRALGHGVRARTGGDGAGRAAAARAAARAELAALHPAMPMQLAMVEAIRAALPGAIIVGDSTQPVYAGNLFHDHDRPGGWFNAATGFGALGYGPGAAVGAALADPAAAVVCLVGDGGLQFSVAELRTARDEGLAVTFVVWNNAGYREIAEAMQAVGVAPIGCDPTPLDHAALAAACGLPFASVAPDPDALRAALRARGAGPGMVEIRAG